MSLAILQLVDSLAVGGTETVAVNLANALAGAGQRSFLCATRAEGPLRARLQPEVGYLFLARRHRFDLGAVRRLRAFVRTHGIQLVHAHSSSLWLAVLAGLGGGFPAVVWHDHYGRGDSVARARFPHALLGRRVRGVIGVNRTLADWAVNTLHIPRERVWQIPNFVLSAASAAGRVELPGTAGLRVICLANLRPQKNHGLLVDAFRRVHAEEPAARLFLAGATIDAGYAAALCRRVEQDGLAGVVAFLGAREDVPALLAAGDVGVLSSDSEGFPLALLDYGTAGLATVATDVGQCREILADGRAGLLVPPRDPAALAAALLALCRDPVARRDYGQRLQQHVADHYSREAVLQQVTAVYARVLPQSPGPTKPRTR